MKLTKCTFSIVLLLCMLLTAVVMQSHVVAAENNHVLLARDAEWRYLDNGTNLGTLWRTTDFNDSTWKKGNAPLGFGDDFSETDPSLALATPVNFGDEDDKHITTYFRTSVNVDQLSNYSALEIYIHVDDGAVVYINGTETFRRGIANGVVVDYKTGAKFKQKEETFNIPVTALKTGVNIIAVEVHQDDGSSSDLWFEMGIKGIIK